MSAPAAAADTNAAADDAANEQAAVPTLDRFTGVPLINQNALWRRIAVHRRGASSWYTHSPPLRIRRRDTKHTTAAPPREPKGPWIPPLQVECKLSAR